MKKIIPLLLITALILASCTQKPTESTTLAMSTVCTQTVYAQEETVLEAENLLSSIEQTFSRYIDTSDIFAINKNAGHFTRVSEETYYVLERATDIAEKTQGAFDPTLGKVSELWDFSGEPTLPDEEQLRGLVEKVSYENIEFDEATLSVKIAQGQALDTGAIVKGYAGDALLKYYSDGGVTDGLLNLGGNMTAFGDKEGAPFVVGIRDPLGEPGSYFCTVELRDVSLVTSGGYERFFEQNAQTYHHILDPSTGYPARTDILSASVLSEDGLLADALSTAIFVMGSERGLELAADMGAEALLLLTDNTIIMTDGFEDATNLQLHSNDYTRADG